MACMQISKKAAVLDGDDQVGERTRDGTVDMHGRPAIGDRTGKWVAGMIILLNQGLATLAFFGVGVNLVLFLTRVMGEGNANAANSVSKWTGTVYIFSLLGAFLSDSYWGRFKTCAIFQIIYVIGLVLLSFTTQLYLLKPKGCGDKETQCGSHSSWVIGLFYFSIYLVALGNGGYQPNIATFGADQFDDENPNERPLKVAFFSYFYLALNLGSLVSNTILDYFEDEGNWALGFWSSTASAIAALLLFLVGTTRYRHFKPNGNPLSRISQVVVAASKKWRVEVPGEDEELFEVQQSNDNGSRKMLHTEGFRFLDRAAVITPKDVESKEQDPWRLCPISQIEEVKCILRLLPIWLCTIIYSVVFTQMASLFVEQGDAMETKISSFRIPAASMSSFDICSVAVCIFLYRRLLDPLVGRLKRGKGGDDAPSKGGITQLERMGVGLFIAVMAMLSAGIVECYRLKYAIKDQCIDCEGGGFSTLSILWQIPQYSLIGASEVFMYVGQLEFFNEHAPDGLKSFGSALCMTSISLGNYVSSLLVSIIMKISTKDRMPGWIPGNLNRGHLDKFYFLLAGLTILDLVAYISCAKWYKCARLGDKYEKGEEKNYRGV